MAMLRSFEKILGRALAVVPVTVSGIFRPSGQTNPTDGAAIAVSLVDVDGVPYTAGGGGGGGAVTIADGADVALGSTADAAWTGVGNSTAIAALKTIATAALDTTPAAVVGGTAADAALTENPVTIGGRAANATPTAVSANGDVVNAQYDLYGRAIVRESLRENKARTTTTITSSTAETTIVAATASVFHDIFRLMITNTSATATTVTIRDTTGGSTVASFVAGAGETVGFSGQISAAMTQAAVNTNWTAQCGTSVASVIITAEYVNNP